MSKIDLDPITSGYNLSKINANFQKVEDELNNKVLYRNPPAGEPNSMSSNLDMNSRSILNASKISSNVLELGGVQVVPTNLAVDPYNGTREALRRSYAEAGYNLVSGSFEVGGTLVGASDVLLHEASGKAFSGPVGVVTPGTDPMGGGFVDRSLVVGATVAISVPNFDKNVSHRFLLNGTPYVYDETVTGIPDGPNVVSGAYYFVVNGDAFKKVYADRGVYHINQLGHVFGENAAPFVLAAAQFARQVEITGWEMILDGGFELSIPIYGKGAIKQSSGDNGVVIVTGGGLYGGVTIDCQNSDKKRSLAFKKGSASPFVDNVSVKNINSSTFVFGLFIENAGVTDFKVRRFSVDNLYAAPSGTEGDANGVCRAISVSSSSSLLPSDTVSSGNIEFINAKNMATWEDCDAIAVQCIDSSGVTRDADITVSHVKTRGVLKRAVKIQANGVSVQDVDARSTNAKPMYSVVSYYGSGGVVRNVRGAGVNNGVDILGYAAVSDVDVSTSATYEAGGAIQVTGGSCIASGIRSNGLRHVLFINAVLGAVTSVSFSGIKGTSLIESVYLKPANPIGSVDITSGSELTCLDATKYVIAEDLSAASSIGTVTLSSLKMINDHFYSAFLQKTNKLIATDVLCGGGSVGGIKVLGGSAELGGIYSDKALTVELENTTGARAVNIKGKLRLRNTTNTSAALYDSIEEIGTNSGLKKLSWA